MGPARQRGVHLAGKLYVVGCQAVEGCVHSGKKTGIALLLAGWRRSLTAFQAVQGFGDGLAETFIRPLLMLAAHEQVAQKSLGAALLDRRGNAPFRADGVRHVMTALLTMPQREKADAVHLIIRPVTIMLARHRHDDGRGSFRSRTGHGGQGIIFMDRLWRAKGSLPRGQVTQKPVLGRAAKSRINCLLYTSDAADEL